MTEAICRYLFMVGLGLACGWWVWAWLSWRNEQHVLKRVEHSIGMQLIKPQKWMKTFIFARDGVRRHFQSKSWRKETPDFFELLALAQSAGMNLSHAWSFASRMMMHSALRGPLQNVESMLARGQSWDQALETFADGLHDRQCTWVVGLMRQNLRRGSPLVTMLLEQVEQWRYAEAMNAERRAQTLSLKLLLPIFLFLLPAVFIVLFAPILMRFSGGF